jgi:hypothetical protein
MRPYLIVFSKVADTSNIAAFIIANADGQASIAILAYVFLGGVG